MGGKVFENARRVSRAEAEKIVPEIEAAIREFCSKVECCGSYRRGEADMSDLDFVFIPSEMTDEELNSLKLSPLAIDLIGGIQQTTGCRSTISFNGIQLDFTCASEGNFGAMCLYFTGSKHFNIISRTKAKKRGLKLNQYGLFDDKTGYLISASESGILEALCLEKYLNPITRSK